MTALEELEENAGKLTAWEMDVARIITEIPFGRMTTYGCLARIASERHRHSPNTARSVGNLRKKLYGLLRDDTEVPLHRIATQGDLRSAKDSVETTEDNERRRDREGTTRDSDAWWCPCD